MQIIQLLPTLAYGDAVSNDAIALKQVIKEMGYKTDIYAENIDTRLPSGTVHHVNKMPKLNSDDILMYHLSTGTKLNYQLSNYKCRKIMIYHNITPPHFFKGYHKGSYQLCNDGYKGVVYLADKIDYCISDSLYNCENLTDMNYKCKIDVLPILIPFHDYESKPNREVLKKYSDSTVNIVFTGRVAPNKKHEDIIEAFYYYKNNINHNSRLFLVGSYTGMDKYYDQLNDYIKKLNLSDVIFTGHIKFDEILAYYKLADVFLCMSEHEGFCVPLVEAMYFNVPIIAFDSSAIAGTLGGSGLLLKEKDPIMTAELIHKVVNDKQLKQTLIHNQRIRLQDFSYDVIKNQFKNYLNIYIGDKK